MPDEAGLEFADDDEARSEAIVAARAMLEEVGKDVWQQLPLSMDVRDERGTIIDTLRFSANRTSSR